MSERKEFPLLSSTVREKALPKGFRVHPGLSPFSELPVTSADDRSKMPVYLTGKYNPSTN